MALTRRDALILVAPATAFGSQANSAVSFGIIGAGARGTYVGTQMAKDPRTRLVALCDVFPDRLARAQQTIPGAGQVRTCQDYRELLSQSDIDAVLIATPVFLHPLHFEAAVGARKHIYCEKPAGADVAGVKRLLRAAGRADKTRTIQFGFQQRYSPEYLAAEKILREGKIGKLNVMMGYWELGGLPPQTFKSPHPPEEQKLRHWLAWMDLSGGPSVECDCHGVDVLNWFAGAHPLQASGGAGLRYPRPYGNWTADHWNIHYQYPDGITGWQIGIRYTAGYRDVKEQFFGSHGLLETHRSYYRWHGPIPSSKLVNDDILEDRSRIEERRSKREITIDAVENFFTSIVEKKPHDTSEAAVESTLTSLLGRMAFEQKRPVTWEEMMRLA